MLKIILGVVVFLALSIFVAGKMSSTMHVEHTLNAPVAQVWKLWNDPESIKKWWSPKDFTSPTIKNDLRVGGKFLFSMKSAKGEMYWNAGTYTEVVPQKKIVQNFSFSDENGNLIPGKKAPVPGSWPDFVTVTAEFKEDGQKTHVSVTEEGIPLLMKILAKMGWEQQFDKFDALIASH